jgi:hypothetical protein
MRAEKSFDGFVRNHATGKENQARLMAEIKTEYERLKSSVSQFAADKKGLPNGPMFEWGQTNSGRPMLTLGNVAAVFEAPVIFNSVSQDNHIRIRFTRKFGSEQENDGNSPLEEVFWNLKPLIPNDAFAWTVPDKNTEEYSTEALADEIAKRLAQYHVAYERAFGRVAQV